MEFRVAGNELHLSGRVQGDELATFKDVEAAHGRAIDTVVFRDSPGGDSWTAYRVGERILGNGWRTVLAGRCASACAVMFLGGRSRHFAQVTYAERMFLGFHGTWSASFIDGQAPAIGGHVALRDWIRKRTGDRVEPVLLERFLGGKHRATLLYVFDPQQFKHADGSVYFCEGNEAKGTKPWEGCEKIAGRDAHALGFVNSDERIKVRPPSALPAPFKAAALPAFPR